MNTNLTALSPLDGRYQHQLEAIRPIFSEYGLIRFRVQVELAWLQKLTQLNLRLPPLDAAGKAFFEKIINEFSVEQAQQIKAIELTINHDVKAVEYFLKELFSTSPPLNHLTEFVHFGCTSEDINNLAYGLMLVAARKTCILPMLDALCAQLKSFAIEFADLSMLSRTHGQSATPTTLGKEIANTLSRLTRQIDQLKTIPVMGKMNGATGNYNALKITCPDHNWPVICEDFVRTLGLQFNPYTTQIEPHDALAEFFAIVKRINIILIDFCRDTWSYIAMGYYQQKAAANEVGSSTMPHKINPINFENAEGNLGIANALLEHMENKLPISRFQRDLSDSTVLRNIGVAFSHALLAYEAVQKGLNKLQPDRNIITADLNQHWEILSEAVQTVMRYHGLEQPYEKLKTFTRGKKIDKFMLQQFIENLALPSSIKESLLALTPETYNGYAEELAKKISQG